MSYASGGGYYSYSYAVALLFGLMQLQEKPESNSSAASTSTSSGGGYTGAAPPLNVVLQQSHSAAAFAPLGDDGKPQVRRVMLSGGSSASGRLGLADDSSSSNATGGGGGSSARRPPTFQHSASLGRSGVLTQHSTTLSGSAASASQHQQQLSQSGVGGSASGGGGGTASLGPAGAGDVLLSGALCKRGHIFKNWLSRHFVLSKLALSYYRKNPFEAAGAGDADAERKLLKGEIVRGDVVRVEAADGFKNRPFCFVVVVRKRARRASHHLSALSCLPSSRQHHPKESSLLAKGDDGPVVLYYIQAAREVERQKWLQALERWLDGECPAQLGHTILQYIVNNAYSSYRYEQKKGGDRAGDLSPAAQAGRAVEQDFPVLANLVRDLHECQQEDEMVYILDQILGEVKDGAASASIKKLLASAGEEKLAASPGVWTAHVKLAYAKIMKALRAQASSRALHAQRGRPVGGRPSPTGSRRPRLLDTRQHSYGGGGSSGSTGPSPSLGPSLSLGEPDPTSFHALYKLGRKLGSGAFSVVHIATHRETRKQVAVKCIAKTSLAALDAAALQQEVAIMRGLDHPNLVPLLAYFDARRHYFLVTPLCTGGELFDDLVVQGQPYGAAVDCWSLGVILFILLCGYPPFPGSNHAAILSKVVSADFEFESPFWDHVSADAKDLVAKLLTVDPAQRLAAAGILSHPWMRDGDAAREQKATALPRVASTDLRPALLQMRKHSLTHEKPKIRPSDMNVDALELARASSVDNDAELLELELGRAYSF
ncbi:hypothetical protein PybrP1_004941 [[Pythium] brassicae (nom. inval.)]|nr:hypothetical protein PybrP1_004941 [[Pythium] brassicae (nom. inval.)]